MDIVAPEFCREAPTDATRRRWWLLTEALKYSPLREALEIARKAEVFLLSEEVVEAALSRPERTNEGEATSDATASQHESAVRYLH